jgi:hypothetical protein
VTEQDDAQPQRTGRRAERLFGAAAEGSAPRPPQERPETPPSVRWAAVVVGVEAVAIWFGALVLLWLTLTGTPESVSRAFAEVVLVAAGAAVLTAAAVGLWRVSSWARGPVVALQILLGLLAFTTAFQAGLPLVGLPVLGLVGAVLYLLATPGARLAFFRAG